MREHQVVINLKREQFEEVQRLARLAGSRSPSAYLRDRILNLLGMEQAEHRQQGSTDTRSASDLTGVNQELSRMHRELQVFIAESLSSGSYLFGPEGEQTAFDEPYPPYVEVERQLEKANEILSSQAGQPSATAYGAPPQGYPGVTYSTGSMAAGSPQIHQVPGQAPGEQSAAGQSQDPGSQPWQTEAQQTDPNAALSTPAEPGFGGAAGSSGTIGSRMASYQNVSKYSNLFLPGAGIFDSRPQTDSGVWMIPGIEHMAGNSSLGLPSEINEAEEPIDQVSDELEELADRAFAISPRLGTTEEPRPRTELRVSDDDPLRDLLDDVLVEHIQQTPAVEDSPASSVVYAPLPDEPVYGTTAAEVESEAISGEESQPDLTSGGAGSTSADDEDSYASAIGSDDETVTSSFPDQETDLEQSQSEESQPDDERGDIEEYLLQVSDENQSSAPAPTRPPMDTPPPKRRKPASDSSADDSDGISGGPPPKRRRKPH